MKISKLLRWGLLGVLLALVMSGVVAAQDSETDSGVVIVSGEVVFEDGVILVDGYVIAPAGAFIPADLEEGDLVVITGIQIDENTVQAWSLEYDDIEDDEDVDPEAIDEAEATAEPEEEAVDDAIDDEDSFRGVYCADGGLMHPAAAGLSEEFDVDYELIIDTFCETHLGFGEIMRILVISESLGDVELSVEDLLALRAEGGKWRDLLDEYDLSPSDIAPGRTRGRQPWSDEDTGDSRPGNAPENPGQPADPGNGNGNGNGRGNGNGGGNPPQNPGPPANPGGGRGGGGGGRGNGNGG